MKRRGSNQAGQTAPHQVYAWSGSAYEIGFQHGQTLRNEIISEARAAVEVFVKGRRCTERKALQFALGEWQPLFERHTPRAIEEIKGIAAGGGFDFPWMFFASVHGGTKYAPPSAGECTAFVCGKKSTHGGKVLMGQTKDTTAPLTRYRIMRLNYNDGPAAILLNYPGWLMHLGLSHHGLACTGNSLYARQPSMETMPITFLRRLAMEKESVDEVLKAIRGVPLDNGCTMLGDPNGRLVCIECVAGKTNIRDVSGHAFCHANSVLCEQFQQYENAVLDSPSSPLRQTNLQRLLNAKRGSITIEDLKRFVADHTQYPLSVCRHRCDEDPLWTTAAFAANLSDRELHIAIGNPCVARFEKYDFSPMKVNTRSPAFRHQAA